MSEKQAFGAAFNHVAHAEQLLSITSFFAVERAADGLGRLYRWEWHEGDPDERYFFAIQERTAESALAFRQRTGDLLAHCMRGLLRAYSGKQLPPFVPRYLESLEDGLTRSGRHDAAAHISAAIEVLGGTAA